MVDFFQQLRSNLERLPEHVALQNITEEGKEAFTFRRIGEEVSSIAVFLQSRGIGPGDRVGILMENHPRWGIAFLAAQSAGATVVPFDVLHHADTLARLVQHAECRYLISSAKMLPHLEEVQALLPKRLPALVPGHSSPEYDNWEAVVERGSREGVLPLVSRKADDPLVVIYTSGTTGDPKGVILTERNVYRNMEELLKIVEASPSDHILSVLPLYHVLALMTNFIIPLYVAARVTYLDVLDAPRILKTFQDEGVSIFVCVPQFFYLVHRRIFQEIDSQPFLKRFLFRRLYSLSHFANERLGWNPGKLFFSPIHKKFGSQFRVFGVGGARFDREVAESFRNLGFTIIQAYGMTETAALATVTPPSAEGLGSVGRPLPHVQIRIQAPDDQGIGEVLIAGDNIMQGYLKNLQATDEVLENGWLHSGDLGYLDSEGFLHVTGRKKDVIVLSSGKNIFPEEVEHFYQSNCPLIKEICVVGVKDFSSGQAQEKLHAVIVPDFDQLKAQQVANAFDMIRYLLETLSQQLPAYKRVRTFEIRTEPLPRTTTRKIKRFQVEQELGRRGQEEAPRFREESVPENENERKLFELIRQFKTLPLVNRDMNLELDVGLDSLERVELLSNLQEAFRVEIPEEEATAIYTVRELMESIEKHLSGEALGESAVLLSWADLIKRPLTQEEQQRVSEIFDSRVFRPILVYLTAKLAWVLSKVFFRLRVQGQQHLPHKYPFLICPNHLSFLDVFVVVAGLPFRVIRRMFFLGYSDYFSSPGMAYLGRILRVVPVDADRHLRQALRLGAEGVRRGLILCIFPEGERSIDGTLKPFRKGPAILANDLQAPAVPVGITGSYEAWQRGSSKIRLHPIQVRFGPAVVPDGSNSYDSFNKSLFQSVAQLTRRE